MSVSSRRGYLERGELWALVQVRPGRAVRFLTSAVAHATDGSLVGTDISVEGASIDSREITPGALFVPVVAERDGHEFVEAALRAGASAYLTDREPDAGGTAVIVGDTTAALQRLGVEARRRLPDRVVAVTGSVGKTTVKDLAAAALSPRYATSASVRSFNNELGVPLTLINAPDGTEAVVVEMGSRGLGHVAELCSIAQPTVGVVTTVGLAHTEQFGTLDEVAQAKGELVEALPSTGTAVLNADVADVVAMATRTAARVVTFGRSGADVVASEVTLDAELRPHFRLDSPWGRVEVTLGVRGEHQVENALAAAASAFALDVSPADVAAGLESAAGSPWRMDLRSTPSGAMVLNDAYNANPASTSAALRSLARVPAARRVAVLGPMAELGKHSSAQHEAIAVLAAELGIGVIAVGAEEYGDSVDHVGDIGEALERLGPVAGDTAVLVKGSRVAGLERVAEVLLAAD